MYIYIYIYIFIVLNLIQMQYFTQMDFSQLFFTFCNRLLYDSLNCPQNKSIKCEKMDFRIIQSLLEGSQICRICWKTKECEGLEGFF